jgi:outer membrane protein assembly factor BamB
MPVPNATRFTRRLRRSAISPLRSSLECHRLCQCSCLAIFLGVSLAAHHVQAQAIQFRLGASLPTQLTPPQVDLVSGPTASRLEQARALVADKSWDEAVDIYRDLLQDTSGRLVELGDGRYLSLPTYCHVQLSQLPPEGLATYRRRVDPLSEQLYRDGLASRDETTLRRVVDESFCSKWADDALLALGELALERADFEAARRYWEQISPLLRDPTGRSFWLALHGVDLNAQWENFNRLWQQRNQPPNWLAYPDTELDLAGIRARLILASVRAGEFDRAALELEAFRRWHPAAAGRFGGQDGPYLAALDRLLSAAQSWPPVVSAADWSTYGGSLSRGGIAKPLGPILVPIWPQPVPLPVQRRAIPANASLLLGGLFGGDVIIERPQSLDPQQAVRESQQPLSCFPITVGDEVIFYDGRQIRALDSATGRPAMTADGVLYRDRSEQDSGEQRFGPAARFVYASAVGVPRNTLTEARGVVYARVGRPATTLSDSRQNSPAARLVGLDLTREALLTFDARLPDASWSFDGAPVSDGRRVWAALRKNDVTPHAYIACYDAASGAELWRTSIGAADSPAIGRSDQMTHNLLTLVGQRLYFNTNLGLVAAIDAASGNIAWLFRYERASDPPHNVEHSLPLHFDRDPSPCLYHGGLVIVAPSDTAAVFALDALSGSAIWNTNELSDALHLLGVVDHHLIVGGYRLWAIDVRSGVLRFAWPESLHAGIRGSGRGLIAGEEVFWPTRHDIYVLHALTGERTRPPISLAKLGDNGANLAAAEGRLIIATESNLIAFGAPSPTQMQSTSSRTSTSRH